MTKDSFMSEKKIQAYCQQKSIVQKILQQSFVDQ